MISSSIGNTCTTTTTTTTTTTNTTSITSTQQQRQDHQHQNNNIQDISRCLPKLKSLRIEESSVVAAATDSDNNNNSDNDNAKNIITDDMIRQVCKSFSQLQQFTCRHCSHLQFSFSYILTLQHLTTLNLHGNEHLEWNLSDLTMMTIRKTTTTSTTSKTTTSSISNDDDDHDDDDANVTVRLLLPNLRDLRCINNSCLQGDLKDLRHYYRFMTTIDISGCSLVTGNFMDLGHFPNLQAFGMARTLVEGDLRDILLLSTSSSTAYPALQLTGLDNRIYGATELHRVDHAADVMRARHQLRRNKQKQKLLRHYDNNEEEEEDDDDDDDEEDCPVYPFLVRLSPDALEYHERIEQRLYTSDRDPPFNIENVVVGKGRRFRRWGWRWSNYLGGVCDVHWLDPEPKAPNAETATTITTTRVHADGNAADNDDDAYAKYLQDLELLREEESKSLFQGFLDPPTPRQYEQLCLERC